MVFAPQGSTLDVNVSVKLDENKEKCLLKEWKKQNYGNESWSN